MAKSVKVVNKDHFDNILVDGMVLAYQCEHGMGHLCSSVGVKTGMVFGFLRSLLSYKKIFGWNRTKRLIVAWDSKGQIKKAVDFPAYKGNRIRSSLSQAVYENLPLLKSVLRRTGFEQVSAPGYEADDILHTLVRRHYYGGSVVVTADSDLYQVLGIGCKAVVYQTSASVKELITEEAFLKNEGYQVGWYTIVKSIYGDKSDNVKGVKMESKTFLS